jgi:hypothetical protein
MMTTESLAEDWFAARLLKHFSRCCCGKPQLPSGWLSPQEKATSDDANDCT